jgi:hypothetical protein
MNVFSNCGLSLRLGRRGHCIWIHAYIGGLRERSENTNRKASRKICGVVPVKQGQVAAAVFDSICLLSGVEDKYDLSTSLYTGQSNGLWKDLMPRKVHDCQYVPHAIVFPRYLPALLGKLLYATFPSYLYLARH